MRPRNRNRTSLALLAGVGLLLGADRLTAAEGGFTLKLDPLVLGFLEADIDTDSAKLEEYRDFDKGFVVPKLHLFGASADGDRWLDLQADKVRRDDARYTLRYGLAGRYSLLFDYNKIPHRFGNAGHMLWTRTGPGRYEIADPVQQYLQDTVTANRSRLSFPFLDDLLRPILASATEVDLGLQRDRTLARFDLGKMGRLAWGFEYTHENRTGNRPLGTSFGFSNDVELPEPIDYDTTGALLSGEWRNKRGGLAFGYRYSKFENNVSTLIWDNPFRITPSTDANAYSSPGTGSVGGSNLGFNDLAAENESDSLYVSGRTKLGGNWFVGGSYTLTTLEQDEPLLPYTLNAAIEGINFNGSKFNATDPANLPARNAGMKAEITNLTADLGTHFADRWHLNFRYRYYDYDNQSQRIEFPGYVRFHAVWEEVPRITVPYSYTKEDLGAELDWDLSATTNLALSYNLQSWDREFREVKASDEDTLKLSVDSRPTKKLQLRASWETGDRSIDHYDVEAMEDTYLDPAGPNNQPGLRKYDEAARNYDSWNASAQLFATDAITVYVGVSGREDDYDESEFGLLSDEILQYSFEFGYTPGAGHNVYVFGQRADREVFQKARQSGGTVSTRTLDDWSIAFDEVNDLWGLGWTVQLAERWKSDLSARWSNSDGEADFTASPGGLPLGPPAAGLPPRTAAQDFDNYEDVELLQAIWKLDYKLTEAASVGFWYQYEDYTIDSFILQGLRNYLPGTLLLNANNGDYTANLFALSMKFAF